MQIIINLNDPAIQEQITAMIEARLSQVTAEQIQHTVDQILETKLDRLSDAKIDQLAQTVIEKKVGGAFIKANWSTPSEFSQVLAEETRKLLNAHFKEGR